MNEFRHVAGLPGIPAERVPLRLDDSALLIVDMQRYWTEPSGPIGRLLRQASAEVHGTFYAQLQQTVIPNIASLLDLYRAPGLPIVHITTGSTRADGADLPPFLRRRFLNQAPEAGEFSLMQVGTDWHLITERLLPQAHEVSVNKRSRSAFNSTEIDQVLRNLGVRHLVVTGQATHGCVDLTARDAVDLGYETFLVGDACTTYHEADHLGALEAFAQLWGQVLNTDQISAPRG